MIETRYGDILKEAKGILVHGCNAQGVMGSGIAKQVKKMYPEAYDAYKAKESREGLVLSEYSGRWVESDKYICNLITQKYFGRDGKVYASLDAIREGFKYIVASCEEHNNNPRNKLEPQVNCINFPLIGCGLGGLNWEDVSKVIDEVVPDEYTKVLWMLEK